VGQEITLLLVRPVADVNSCCVQCVVTIIDDDEPGVLGFFDQREYVVEEACQKVELTVVRQNGADGTVTVHYETVAGSTNGEHDAVPGKDFKAASGTLVFQHQELLQTIGVEIIDTGCYEKAVQVILGQILRKSREAGVLFVAFFRQC
jgi:hypothetical protein